jgi:hypothetical protein
MNAVKALATVLALAIVAIVAVRLTKSSSPLGSRPVTASSYGSGAQRNLPADAVLAIAPGSGTSATHRPVSVLSPVMTEFAHARSYKQLYDRLRPASSRTPEEAWILATILKECGKQPNKKQDPETAVPDDVAIARFTAALPERDPSREKRIAAYRQVRGGHCGELKDLQTTPEAIRDLLAGAAAAGDPKASAALVRHDLWTPVEAANRDRSLSMATIPWPSISNAQVQQLQRAAESGDPYALVIAADTLDGPFTNMSLQDAQNGRTMDSSAFGIAARLLACDAGYPCGADIQTIQFGCAYMGRCDAQTLREYEFYYQLAPGTSQDVAAYEQMLTRAVRDHDWSSIAFHPGPAVFLAPYVKP